MQTILAASTDGVPLGVVDEQCWARQEPAGGVNAGEQTKRERNAAKHAAAKRSIMQKESSGWLKAVRATERLVPAGHQVVIVADQEADIFELLALPRRAGIELLVRAHYDRKLAPGSAAASLRQAVESRPAIARISVNIPRGDERAARQAELHLRVARLSVAPPEAQAHRLLPVTLSAILVGEEPRDGLEDPPIAWMLLTTLVVTTAEQAIECVSFYTRRWLIERFHYVLKSGCRIEELQLQSGEGLKRAIASYSYIAWRELSLSYQARSTPQASCAGLLDEYEWQALYCRHHQTTRPPTTPPTLQQAVLWIAMLGGFLARNSDGHPGVKTIWRGLRRLSDIAEDWKLFRSAQHSDTPSG